MKKKELDKIKRLLKKKVVSKSELKKERLSVRIPEAPKESVWEDENRFFKGEFNKEKRRLFFS